jgi:radical SAM superfamily enzyme YgiQ (UPF0313 family)
MITENDSLRRTASYTVKHVNIVLISTYELGRQPFGLVSPVAWLRKRGHDVTRLDLSRQALDEGAIRTAGLIAIYLPMHTATRLAAKVIPRLREWNPLVHLCCYGLYAPMNADYLRTIGVATILGGEFEHELSQLAERLQTRLPADGRAAASPQPEPLISLERLAFEVPDRSELPAIDKYAHLILPGGGFRLVGSTEGSRGCKHLCRHCPIVPVYKGVFRIVSRDVVIEDIRNQVAAGAQHISFGDPDFFNGIRHAIELVREFHREFPAVSYDVTIKIEHLRKYETHLSTLRDTGCLFVVSAVEYLDDLVLRALDKGHTREDFLHVVRTFRALKMILHPTFVPFTQWTTMESYLDLLRVIQAESLIENVAPIQLGIRLLIPEGSRLLELEEVRRVDALGETVQTIAAEGDRRKESRSFVFDRIWRAAYAAAGRQAPRLHPPQEPPATVPFLSEPWYCCAEPTREQFVSIGQVSEKKEEPIPAGGSYV